MAKEEVIIDIKINSQEAYDNAVKAQQAINSLKAEQAALNDAYRAGQVSAEDYAKAQVDINQKMTEQKEVLKANTQEIQTNEGSLVQLRNELKKLTKEYDNLSKADREGAKGMAMQQQIDILTQNITKAEEATGRYQRNVGNYKGKISEAFTAMGGSAGKMISPIKGATNGLKAMSKTPVIAVLGVLVNIIAKVIASLKNNEEAMNKVRESMSAFTGVAKIVQGVVDRLAGFIANLAGKLGELLAKITRTKDALREEQDLTREEIELQRKERQLQVEIAKNENRISDLRLKANQKTRYSNAERLAFVQEAERLETENFERERDMARQRYEIIKRRNAQTASGTKDLDAENDAYVRYLDTLTAYNNRLRELSEKKETLSAAASKATATQKAENDEAEKAAKELQRLSDLALQNAANIKRLNGDMAGYLQMNIDIAQQAYESLAKVTDYTDADMVAAIITAQEKLQNAKKAWEDYQQALTEAQRREAEERAAIHMAEDTERRNEAKAWEEFALDVRRTYQDAFEGLVASTTRSLGTLGAIFGEFAEKNKGMAVAEAALSLSQVYIDQAVAIAKGVRAAMSEPFPMNLAAIGTTTAAILSTIASSISTIKKTKEQMQQYAEGGLIQGAGTGTSDSITAKVSNGEFVVNAESTRKHLSELVAINGGWGNTGSIPAFARGGGVGLGDMSALLDSASLTRAIAEAVSRISPVVSVAEITRVANRVKVKENISRQ